MRRRVQTKTDEDKALGINYLALSLQLGFGKGYVGDVVAGKRKSALVLKVLDEMRAQKRLEIRERALKFTSSMPEIPEGASPVSSCVDSLDSGEDLLVQIGRSYVRKINAEKALEDLVAKLADQEKAKAESIIAERPL